jgi:hypothetical protein
MLKDILKDVAKLLLGYMSCAIVSITGLVLIITVATIVGRLNRPTIREVTSPLEPSIVHDLCQKLDLPAGDPLCQSGAVVYAPDFFLAVKAEFTPGVTTYEDVQEKLAAYRYRREPVVRLADGTASYRCWYDFQGDRVFPVVFVFTEDGLLEQLLADTGDDWP